MGANPTASRALGKPQLLSDVCNAANDACAIRSHAAVSIRAEIDVATRAQLMVAMSGVLGTKAPVGQHELFTVQTNVNKPSRVVQDGRTGAMPRDRLGGTTIPQSRTRVPRSIAIE